MSDWNTSFAKCLAVENMPSKGALASLHLRCRGANEGAKAFAGGLRIGWNQFRQTGLFLHTAALAKRTVEALELQAAFYAMRCGCTRGVPGDRKRRRKLSHFALASIKRAARAKLHFVERAKAHVANVRELESIMLAWFPCIFVGHAASSGFLSKGAEVSLRAINDCTRMKAMASSRIIRFSGSHMCDSVCDVDMPVEFKGPSRQEAFEDYVGGIDGLVSARFMRHQGLGVTFRGLCRVLGVDDTVVPPRLSACKIGCRLWPWDGKTAFDDMLYCASSAETIWEGVGWAVPSVDDWSSATLVRSSFHRWKGLRTDPLAWV